MLSSFEWLRDMDNQLHCKRVKNNFCYEHFHSNVEVIYVFDGEIEVDINGETQLLRKGYSAIAVSFDTHTYNTPKYSDTAYIILPLDMMPFYVNAIESKHFGCPFLPAGPHSAELEYSIEKLRSYDLTFGDMIATGYIHVILGHFFNQLELLPNKFESSNSLIRNILLYLERNYLNQVSIAEIAGYFGYNKFYISKSFNQIIQCSIPEYLNMLRARHAARLIQTTHGSLANIAAESGFSSIRTFNRAFYELYKTTPSAYKSNILL